MDEILDTYLRNYLKNNIVDILNITDTVYCLISLFCTVYYLIYVGKNPNVID